MFDNWEESFHEVLERDSVLTWLLPKLMANSTDYHKFFWCALSLLTYSLRNLVGGPPIPLLLKLSSHNLGVFMGGHTIGSSQGHVTLDFLLEDIREDAPCWYMFSNIIL